MERKAKVELFEQIRREYEFGNGSVRGIAQKYGVHRRMVRQALADAVPPTRKAGVRERPKLKQIQGFVDLVLEQDRRAPRKQRHSARRIYRRLVEETGVQVSESTVRQYVGKRKRELGLVGSEVFIPQSYQMGEEGQVDWYEAWIEVGGERQAVQIFSMRSMASGGAFHRAYWSATQQAFFEAHERAFHFFGGVFSRLRYDNLGSAVRRILRGSNREQQERFIAFRSHWKFEATFCQPGKGHEKGGVEGEVGYFRRNHLVPVPCVTDLAQFNHLLAQWCAADGERRIGDRQQPVGELMVAEQSALLGLAEEGFELAEICFPRVDAKRCVKVKTNFYSVPVKPGTQVQVRVLPQEVEIVGSQGVLARHPRCYGRHQQLLELEHYLDVLLHKPGALAGSKPLAQCRAAGRWPPSFDQMWERLQERHGSSEGTRKMIELLEAGRTAGMGRLTRAIEQTLAFGGQDVAAVQHLLRAEHLQRVPTERVEVGELARYERPLPVLSEYDRLLTLNQEVPR